MALGAEGRTPIGGTLEGQTLGDYRLLRPIAAGGMAAVYLARKAGPRGFAQNAAVKVVHPHLALQQEFVDMFLDEARIISLINHPNVCRVLDFGASQGTYFLAMEYVRGETWAEVLTALRAHPEGEAALPKLTAWVLAQTCEGLHAAHQTHDEAGLPLRIVHRDISPQNLLVGYDGSVRIVDFGVAYAAERAHATRDGSVKGRYGYMAPEQMRGEAVDLRADLWSVGVILREALTGGRLFARENDAATIFSVTEQPMPAWPSHVSMALRAVADCALSKPVEGRFATARDMGRELMRICEAELSSVAMSHWMEQLFRENIAFKATLLREIAQVSAQADTALERLPMAARSEEAAGTSELPGEEAIPSVLRRPRSAAEVEASIKRRKTQAPYPAWFWPAAFAGVAGCAALLVLLFANPPSSPAPAPGPVPTVEVDKLVVQIEPASMALEPPAVAPEPGEQAGGVLKAESVKPASPKATQDAATEKTSRKPARTAETGSVALGVVGGWADVFLGTRHLGTTPMVATLPVGAHTLLVYPMGKGPAQRVRVQVRAGVQTKQKLTLP